MKKYIADIWNSDIKEVECVRETAKVVFRIDQNFGEDREFRHAKLTNDGGYFDTKEEAIKWKANSLHLKASGAYRRHQQTHNDYIVFCGAHKLNMLPVKR